MSVTSVSFRFEGRAPSKPPLRYLRGELRMATTLPEGTWFVLPRHVDEPLRQPGSVTGLELQQLDCGTRFVDVYGAPWLALFRVGAGAEIVVRGWAFQAVGEVSSWEVWAASEVVVSGAGPLADLVADGGPLAAPREAPNGRALLASMEVERGTELKVDVLERHRIAIAAGGDPYAG